VKTVAVEANLDEDSAERAMLRVARLADAAGLRFEQLDDESLALVSGERGAIFVDALDPRFWLVHSLAQSDFLHGLLREAVRSTRDLDWCWLPRHLIEDFRHAGNVEWFKTDFEADQLTPARGDPARRLRVQLEGDGAYRLLQLISGQVDYSHAAALTAMAVEFSAPDVGTILEVADYKGRFAATGNSFELHVGLVSRMVRAYAEYVRGIERRFALEWTSEEDGGLALEGEVVGITFVKRVQDFDTFLAGLFSCRDPFRLWGVPRRVTDSFASVEAVDLHVGTVLPIDISADGLRVYLRDDSCGNSVARLVANLQHRYDATIRAPIPA